MKDLDRRSLVLRRQIVQTIATAGRGHLASALSIVEILRVLYDEVLRYRPEEPDWPDRDHLVLSKGHGCLAHFILLAEKGFFPSSELDRFERPGSILGGHPEAHKVPGVEVSTGALGHGLPIALGIALATRMQRRDSRVIVILGDGEINEGSVWESAMYVAKHRLSHLTAIIDYNKFQLHGPTSEVLDLEPLADKWRSFGFTVTEANGHDVIDLRRAFADLPLSPDGPSAIICHTIKGKGLPFAENTSAWHSKNELKAEEEETLRQGLVYLDEAIAAAHEETL